jgi:hypothetical protein
LLKKINITGERLLVVIILIIAAFLRFWDFGSIPFMHDEFSAIFRTRYDSLSEVIQIGVKQNDTHPAGVQIFIYLWIKLYGLSEPLLKFPFALLGVGSVYLSWKVARRWFNENTALFTALIMAVTQYNIFYSQLARPYEPGLFFSLLTVWFWTKVVFDEFPKTSSWIWFVVFMAVNSYIHAFTLFFNLLVGATGLFFVRGIKLKYYLLAGLAVLILFIPGIPVFTAQLGRGDIGGWLGPPKPDFLIQYFRYVFHYSQWFLFTVLAITTYLSVKYFNSGRALNRFRLIGFFWFLITFLTAYFYSVWRSPIIQYSTLLFVFPFLLMAFFSFFNRLPKGTLIVALSLILITGVFTLVYERLHYRIMYKQGFDQIPARVISDLNKYDDKKVAIVLQSPDTRMFDYYFKKYGTSPDYFKTEREKTPADVIEYIKSRGADVVLFGWADHAPPEYLETVKTEYPLVVEQMSMFNSEYWVLAKGPFTGSVEAKRGLLKEREAFKVFSKNKYGKAIKIWPDSVSLNKWDVINVQLQIGSDSVVGDAMLVIDWRDTADNPFYWSGAYLNSFFIKNNNYYVTASLRLGDLPEIPENSLIKFYIWKKDDSEIMVKNMSVFLTRVDPVENGLFENIR